MLCTLCLKDSGKNIEYQCGTRIRKFFPKCKTNPQPGWYTGTVKNHEIKNGWVANHVVYDDGDHETMTNDEILHFVVKVDGEQDETPRKKARYSTNRIKSEDASPLPVEPDVLPSTLQLDNPPSSVVTPTGVSSTSLSDRSTARPEASLSSSNEKVVPDAALSAADSFRHEVVSGANQDIQIKEEGSATSLSPAERQKREASFRKWQTANTDPATGQGRYVFRRACHAHCITKVLGGSGMQPWPTVKNPPVIDGYEKNPFIDENEIYVAGNEVWNPFGPRFPGDKGLVDIDAFHDLTGQKEFHLFVQCSDAPHKRHWHGKLAAGGRMYVGVYRVPDFTDDDLVSSIVHFKELGIQNQILLARYYVKVHYERFDKRLSPNVTDDHRQKGEMLWNEFKDPNGWDIAKQVVRDEWTMAAVMLLRGYSQEIVPVEFVRFDEDLYRTLVEYDCMTNGTISRPDGSRGRVSLDADALHQYF